MASYALHVTNLTPEMLPVALNLEAEQYQQLIVQQGRALVYDVRA